MLWLDDRTERSPFTSWVTLMSVDKLSVFSGNRIVLPFLFLKSSNVLEIISFLTQKCCWKRCSSLCQATSRLCGCKSPNHRVHVRVHVHVPPFPKSGVFMVLWCKREAETYQNDAIFIWKRSCKQVMNHCNNYQAVWVKINGYDNQKAEGYLIFAFQVSVFIIKWCLYYSISTNPKHSPKNSS